MTSNVDGSGNNDDVENAWTYPGGAVQPDFVHDAEEEEQKKLKKTNTMMKQMSTKKSSKKK